MFTPKRSITKAVLAVVVCLAFTAASCNVAQWIATAQADLPIVLQIVANILSIISLAQSQQQINPNVAANIQKYGAEAENLLVTLCGKVSVSDTKCAPDSLIGQYQAADASAKAALLPKIDAALASIQSHMNAILQIAHVTDQKIQIALTGAVTLVLTTLLAIQSLIPAPANATAARRALTPYPQWLLSRKDLKKAYNVQVAPQFPALALN